jgi:tetratricopeptide (TPR) repeat protein
VRLALCVLLCSLGVAHAQTPTQTAAKATATDAYREGQRRYAAGEYAAAAAGFLAAYDADPDPVYLFNAAQAFRFAGDCVQAASYYRRFLSTVASAPNLDRVRANLDEMDACAKRLAPPQPSAAPHSPPPSTAPPVTATAPAPPRGDPGATRRHIGLALGAGGLAAAAVGVWFHHDVGYFEQRVADCTPARPCSAEQVDRWNDRGHRASTVAIASYSVAGAALVGGAALYLLGRADTGERSVAIAPTRGGAMIAAGGAF